MDDHQKKFFDKHNGRDVYIYPLENEYLSVGITDFGAAVNYIRLKAFPGCPDICLGFYSIDECVKSGMYAGATVGRVTNRVRNSEFSLNGKKFRLVSNEGRNQLHGGPDGFSNRIFSVDGDEGTPLRFTLLSPDADQGFPGRLMLEVRYSLYQSGLLIRYRAVSDRDTVWAPTCHVYFNLNGRGSAENTYLRIYADEYTPIDNELIPTGKRAPVKGTPFDFTEFETIGSRLYADDEQLRIANGYDHNYVLMGNHAATAVGVETKITLDVYTDMPGLHFYSGNFVGGAGKNGKMFPHDGFCLEAQYFPNSINEPSFETPVLKSETPVEHYIYYKFS